MTNTYQTGTLFFMTKEADNLKLTFPRNIQAYLEYCVSPSIYGRLPQDTWPRVRVENNTIES
jgi:hypothetical protein